MRVWTDDRDTLAGVGMETIPVSVLDPPLPLDLLVVCDGSAADSVALEHGARLARRSGARLTLLLVLAPRWMAACVALPPCGFLLPIEPDYEIISRFHRLVDRLPIDLPVTTFVRQGSFTTALASIVAERGCGTVIVRGSTTRRRLARLARTIEGRTGTAVRVLPATAT